MPLTASLIKSKQVTALNSKDGARLILAKCDDPKKKPMVSSTTKLKKPGDIASIVSGVNLGIAKKLQMTPNERE